MLNRLTCIIFFIFLFSHNLLARVGGGHDYGGGGGGFGGSHSSGGDGIDIMIFIHFIINYPIIGIPLLIIAILFFIFGSKKANDTYQTRTISRYNESSQNQNFNRNLAELQQQDPAFDPEVLSQRISQTFINLQQFWSNREIEKIRPFVTDGIYENFKIVLERYQQQNMYNRVENINVHSCEAVDIDLSPQFHSITFKITASANDSMRDLETQKVLTNSHGNSYFTEYWSFLRKPGAKTINQAGLMEGNCPNCGYLLEIKDKVICPSCKALICSGEYDWLLAEISQNDWQPEGSKTIPGITSIHSTDPGFNRQALEDRTSTTFWNIRRAEYLNSTKFLSKFISPDLLNNFKTSFQSTPNRYFADPAIGKVELLEIVPNKDGKDLAYLKLTWSGHAETKTSNRQLPNSAKSVRIHDVYIFSRIHGTLSNSQNSLTSAHCPTCAAPASDQTTDSCNYCGTPFNDGSRDWILHEIIPYNTYKTQKPKNNENQTSASTPESIYQQTKNLDKELILTSIIEILIDDNELDEDERILLTSFLEHLGISNQFANQLILTVQNNPGAKINGLSSQEKKELLCQIINLCLIDSKITKSEQKLLNSLAQKLGYSQLDLKLILKQQQQKIFQESKKFLKNNR